MITEHEGENILANMRGMETRIMGEVSALKVEIRDLNIASGILFKTEAEQAIRFREIEQRISNHAALRADRAGGKSGGKWGAIAAGLATILVAILERLFVN